MALDTRRFDVIEKVVRDDRRALDDLKATVLARLGALPPGGIPTTLLDAKGDLIVATMADTPARLGVGSNNQLLIADSAQSTGVKWGTTLADLAVTGTITKDSAWQALPLTGGWTGDATRVPLMRLLPDGFVQMKGLITKVANPVNGESWITGLAAAYRPLHTWTFLTPTPGRPANTGQVVEIRSAGTGVIFDMAVAPGVISLDMVRYAVI